MASFSRPRPLLGKFVLLGAASLLAAGCHPRVSDPHDPKFIVAEKDNWTITRGELDKDVNGFLDERKITAAQVGPERMPMLETTVLKDMVLEKLLLARAATHQFKDVDKDDADALDRLKGRFPSPQAFQDQLKKAGVTEDELKKRINDQVLIEETLKAEALHDVEPTDKEVNDFYVGHPDLFQVPLKLRASRVLVVTDEKTTPAEKAAKKKKIDQAHARVAKGEDMSKVAMEVSEDRYSAPRGGDIGYFQRGENEAQFDDVAFASKVGVLSPVFETPMGYQFLKVTEIKPAGTLSIDDARAAIVQELKQEKTTSEEKAYTEKLLADSDVKYHIPMVEPPPAPPQPADNGMPTDGGPGADAGPAANSGPAADSGPAGTPVPLPPAGQQAPPAGQ
jgi:peptidyl-prolyl cis-trans isomerase C